MKCVDLSMRESRLDLSPDDQFLMAYEDKKEKVTILQAK